jgi:hypothetical protein
MSGHPDRYQNSTNYEHPQESNLLNLHKTMEYNVLGQPVLRTTLGPTASDGFGRFRVSQPFTLFESFHRYQDNGRIGVYTTGTNSTSTHSIAEGCVIMSIGTGTNAAVYRESNRVFSYQPGKSLLILETFVMGSPKDGLRMRYGYFDTSNGHFLERDGNNIYFVRRSTSTGSIVETKIAKENWNLNKLDGTDASKITLDLSVAQILFTQIEWLGVGSVVQGFVINGEFVPCHRWDWANEPGSTSTYMATACLPVRAEIQNTATTTSSSQLKVICTSVISEGGFELRGRPLSVGHTLATPYRLGSINTLYPVLSIRIKADRLGAVVIPRNFSLAPLTAANYRYQLLSGAITSGGGWQSAGTDSSVEYNTSATSITNGTVLETGYILATNQSSISPALQDYPFLFQLQRNSFTGQCYEFVLAVTTTAQNPDVVASINWEELT